MITLQKIQDYCNKSRAIREALPSCVPIIIDGSGILRHSLRENSNKVPKCRLGMNGTYIQANRDRGFAFSPCFNDERCDGVCWQSVPDCRVFN